VPYRTHPEEPSFPSPAASRHLADMSKHAFLGTDPTLRSDNQAYAKEL
jgi:hypothetical protein